MLVKLTPGWSDKDLEAGFYRLFLEYLEEKVTLPYPVQPYELAILLVSISKTFYACFFRTRFYRQKLQIFVLGLKFWRQKICTKNACVKR